jgi:hypothetical protein
VEGIITETDNDGFACRDRHTDFVAGAPLNLVYVAHGERLGDISAEDRRLYASTPLLPS